MFFFQAEDGIRDLTVTGVQTCALPISAGGRSERRQHGAPDPPGMRGASRREPAAGGDRLGRPHLPRGRPGAWARVRRRRNRAGAGAVGALRPTSVARLAPLSAAPSGTDGVRSDMTPAHDGHAQAPERIELPAPTAWPMVVALGITLAFAGLVTHAAVSFAGIALSLIGAVGWWREVLPEEQVERITLRAMELRPSAVVSSRPSVERSSIGEGGHRTRVPVEVQPYSAGIIGGIVGGIAMPVLAHASLAELRAFSLLALMIGTIVHGLISVLVGLLYAVILPMLPRRHMLWGGVVAPLLWTGLLWAVLGIVDPTLAARVDWPWFVVSQIAFGLAAGFVVARAHPLATMQTWPLAARAGVEASRARSEQERDR